MTDFLGIEVGKCYRNIKTGDVYEVILLSVSSESDMEPLVSYQREGNVHPWTRPLNLFALKFEEVSNVSAT